MEPGSIESMVNSISSLRSKMKAFTDSMGFDLSADIDSVAGFDDAKRILDKHKSWLQDSCNEAIRSVEDFEKELFKVD